MKKKEISRLLLNGFATTKFLSGSQLKYSPNTDANFLKVGIRVW
jgi:hypothetical protein